MFRLFRISSFLFAIVCGGLWVSAQDVPSQTVRGQVIDQDSKFPLGGARIMVLDNEIIGGAIADGEGYFKISDIPVGSYRIQVTYIGFEPLVLNDVKVSSGKEKVLNLSMVESLTQLETVEIIAEDDKHKPLNEMASVSARSFSLEEAKRYPAAAFDPARMAENYAGVTGGGFDMENDIIIRGNSPRYMQWRLEGIEIPNPNHFGSMGNSGGPISMLSSSTLANSDFYTGAFPAEFGNALSGVFDLKMRKGNNEKREFSFMIGALGLEASTEGYFSKKSRASYLINYRYSTLALMGRFVPTLDGVVPVYQDLSFKVNVPAGKAGVFSVFGLGGMNTVSEGAEPDSTKWETEGDAVDFSSGQKMGVVGLTHSKLLGVNTLVKSVLSASVENYDELAFKYLASDAYSKDYFYNSDFQNYSLRLHTFLNHKFNAKNTIRTGVLVNHLSFKFNYNTKDPDTGNWMSFIDSEGSTQVLEAYGQWKYRPSNKVTLNGGLHASYLTLNGSYAIDPRVSAQWKIHPRHELGLALGMHSKPEHMSTYFLEQTEDEGASAGTRKDLDMTRAAHAVLSHDYTIMKNLRLKTEVYFQYLYNIPIDMDSGSYWSIMNSREFWQIVNYDNLDNKGKGMNYGVDVTLEKFFARKYFMMLTGSLFESKYKANDNVWHSTRFNTNYNVTVMGGKEFYIGSNNKNMISINGKFTLTGGQKYTPVNFEASQAIGEQVLFEDRPFEERAPAYYRFDIGAGYTHNGKKLTHTLMVEVQNLTNRRNTWSQYYDSETNKLEDVKMNGLFPFINYRIEF